MWRLVVVLAGCGRIGFAEVSDGDAGSGGTRDATTDATLAAGLRLWFPFDATSQQRDAITGAMADCTGCGTTGTGPRGDALEAAGTTCLRFPSAPALEAPEFTLAVWVRYDGSSAGSVLGRAYDGAGTNWNSYELWMRQTTPRIEFQTTANSTYNESLNGPMLTRQTWIHLAGTFTATSKELYVDGVSTGTMTPAAPLLFMGDPFRIGCDQDSGVEGQWFDGAIDDVRYYDRALASGEILALATP